MTASEGSAGPPLYRDGRAPLASRVADLMGRMTLEEKVAQLRQQTLRELELRDGEVTAASLDRVFGGQGTGTIESPLGAPVAEVAATIKGAQEYLRRHTRLGIPALPIQECLHGCLAYGATIFPQAIAQGATWNPELITAMGAAIAREASAMGVAQALSPLFDLARDPRYGRIEECYGECPYLVSRIGLAFVAGLQGGTVAPQLASDRILATAKHFAGYSVPAGGINLGPASLGEREMRALHLVPFAAAVRTGGVLAVMPSYNEVDGVPAHANHWLLTTVLRREWGFSGYTFADYGGVQMLADFHRVAADAQAAGALALAAGLDLEAPAAWGYLELARMVETGVVPLAQVDAAVERVLRVKFLAGLFDGERGVPPSALPAQVHTPEHVALARRVAEESIILLRNEGGLLPLHADQLHSLALIGPNADQVQFGDYAPSKSNADGVSLRSALRRLLGDGFRIDYAKGCDLVGRSTAGFAAAVAAAERCDVAVVVLGDTSMILSGVGWEDPALPAQGTVGEGFDVTDPVLPGVQLELLQAIQATGRPLVAVFVHGRPYSVPWVKAHVPALVSAFYPGEQQGTALADVLFGRVNPSGRLPVSVAQSAGHIPTVYDHKPSGRGYYHQPGTLEQPGRDYVFSSPAPLWPFGFGLSYTRFAYADLVIENPVVKAGDRVRVRFSLTNCGQRAGKETPQVYCRDEVSSTTTPSLRLVAFDKVDLQPQETRVVALEVDTQSLALWDAAMQCVVEPGAFGLWVGASAEDLRLAGSFSVL